MIYSVNLKKLTEKINPFSFAKYLKDTGWTQFQTKRTYIKVFQNTKPNGDFFQVTIPMEQIQMERIPTQRIITEQKMTETITTETIITETEKTITAW